MVKDHSDSERRNPLPPHRLLFPISSKGYFICIRQDNTYHGHCYASRGALAGTSIRQDNTYSDNERGNLLTPHRLLFPINSKGFFHIHHPTARITHTTAFVTPVVEHWLERASDRINTYSDNERGNLLPPHRLLFPISSKASSIFTIPQPG